MKNQNQQDSRYSFTDLVDINQLEELLKKFSAASGFTTGVLSYPEQELLIGTGWRDICIKYHRACTESEVHCKQSNYELTSRLKEGKKYNIFPCENGLVDGATPIIIEGQHIASLSTGQILLEPPDEGKFRKQAEKYGFNTDEYLKALSEVPIVSEEELVKALEFLSEMAQILAEQGLKELKIREKGRELHESRSYLKKLISGIPDMVWVKDPEGKYLSCNSRFESYLGVKENEVIGKTDYHFEKKEDADVYKERDKIAIESGKQCINEYTVTFSDDGHTEIVETNRTPLYDDKNDLIGVLGIARDITERKKTEEALLFEKDFFDKTINSLPGIFYLFTFDGKMLKWNENFEKVTGKSGDEILKMHPLNFFPEEDRDSVKNRIGEVFSKGYSFVEAHLNSTNGKKIFYHLTGAMIEFEGVPCQVGMGIDINERKLADEALRENEERLRAITGNVADTILQCDRDANITYINHVVEGLTHEDILSKKAYEFVAPEQVETVKKALYDVFNKGLTCKYESQGPGPNGTINVYQVTVSPVYDNEEVVSAVFVARDISEHKQIQCKLEESEKKLREAQKMAQLGYWTWDVNSGEVEWSEEVYNIFRLDPNSFTPQIDSIMKLSPWPEENKRNEELREKVLKNREQGSFEQKFLRPDGSIGYYFSSYQGEYDEVGKLIKIKGTVQDITERKKTEQELKESETRFKALHNASFGGIAIHDKGVILECNRGLSEITGFSYEELIGMNGLLLISDKTRDKVVANINAGFEEPYEAECSHKDGHIFPIRLEAREIPYKGKNVRVVEFRDISEKKRAEKELEKIAKLESLALLGGGIAHNFKNILANISFNISLARHKPDKAQEYMDKMEKGIDQAASLASRFQTFSSGGSPDIKIISVVDVIEESVSIALSGSKISHMIKISESLWNVKGDSKQLTEVLMNLIINSEQSMPDGGYIEITAENEELKDGNNHELIAGNYVKLSLKDTGIGIPKDKISKIFEPFYTDKKDGTGLGLATVLSIIKKHGGNVRANSEEGKWTRFDILLPSSDEEVNELFNEKEEIMKGKKDRIIFMDDNEEIRNNISEFCELLNYKIDVAEDGPKTIELFKKAKEENIPYSVAILDLTIQGSQMQGEDVLKELKKIDPDFKAIIFSGHSTKPIVANFKEYGFTARLDKPVNIEKLSKVLKDVCEEKNKS